MKQKQAVLTLSTDTERQLGWHQLGSSVGHFLGSDTSFHQSHPPKHLARLVDTRTHIKKRQNKACNSIVAHMTQHKTSVLLSTCDVMKDRLTLNIKGDTVSVDLLVVSGDAGERFLVCVSAGHQNVVTLNGECPI